MHIVIKRFRSFEGFLFFLHKTIFHKRELRELELR